MTAALHELCADFPLHRHDYIEMSYVLDGRGREIVNGHSHDMRRGTFSIVLPYHLHEIIVSSTTPLRLYSCAIDQSVWNWLHCAGLDLGDLVPASEKRLPWHVQLDGRSLDEAQRVFDRLHGELTSQRLYRNVSVRACTLEALVIFDRRRRIDMTSDGHQASDKKPNTGVSYEIMEYVCRHFREDLTLPYIASTFYISVPHLSALFKRQTGDTFIHFLHSVRVRHAASLLISTDMKIADIARETGFRSTNSFSRAFQIGKGMSPSAYRDMRSALRPLHASGPIVTS